jgi:hypothetical protein
MKRWKKIALGVVAFLIVAVVGLFIYMKLKRPAQRAVTSLEVDKSAERVARGEYLSTVYGCWGCHSDRDWSQLAGPETGLRGAGGYCFHGAPGRICASNITSHENNGVGAWSDDEILRAIREGVDRGGDALFPIMPYADYKHMSDDDAHAIVAYMRTLSPSDNAVPSTDVDFPVWFFIKFEPEPITSPVAAPATSDRVEYGGYLATVALCKGCHTPVDDKHQPRSGEEFAGDQKFDAPFGSVRSANISPHASGLGDWTEEAFLARFGGHRGDPVAAGDDNTVMPWRDLAAMTDADLSAIYAYLRTVDPQDSVVPPWGD